MRIRPISPIGTLGWPAWIASLALAALLCAVAAYWAVTLLAPRSPIAPPAISMDPRALPELQQAGQLFGLDQVTQAPAQLANVQVVGIVAAGARGSAILGIDGKPPATYAVGEQLNASQRLLEVRSDAVVIWGGTRRFEVPAPAGASLAVLTAGPSQPSSAGAPPPVVVRPAAIPPSPPSPAIVPPGPPSFPVAQPPVGLVPVPQGAPVPPNSDGTAPQAPAND